MPSPAFVMYFLRATQIVFCFVSFVCCLVLVNSSQWYAPIALATCGVWASGIPIFITTLILIFFPRPLQYWSFLVTIDLLAMASAWASFGCLVGTVYYLNSEAIISAAASFIAAVAYGATATRTYRLHIAQLRPKSGDPLKPYLMKKEIDVWCYPVQNEQGQLFMDYEPVSSSGASKAPSEHSTRARSVRSFVRVDDEPSETARPPENARPKSEVETTAGWSIPSQNETLQTFQRSERGSTILPSYRSAHTGGRPVPG